MTHINSKRLVQPCCLLASLTQYCSGTERSCCLNKSMNTRECCCDELSQREKLSETSSVSSSMGALLTAPPQQAHGAVKQLLHLQCL